MWLIHSWYKRVAVQTTLMAVKSSPWRNTSWQAETWHRLQGNFLICLSEVAVLLPVHVQRLNHHYWVTLFSLSMLCNELYFLSRKEGPLCRHHLQPSSSYMQRLWNPVVWTACEHLLPRSFLRLDTIPWAGSLHTIPKLHCAGTKVSPANYELSSLTFTPGMPVEKKKWVLRQIQHNLNSKCVTEKN